jgi:ABC-2 type transport system ATP-binding protein
MDEAEICGQVAIIDHGKIVADDTPDNLKKKHTVTTMKIKTANQEALGRYLKEQAMKYQLENDQFTIFSTKVNEVLEIAATFKASIEDIEINHGTLNDVFIAITGKAIRE